MKVTRGRTYDISDITIDANIAMATHKLTGLGAGSDDNDSARLKQLVDGLALKLALLGGTMGGNIAMGTHKLTGLGAPAAQNDSLRYGQAEIRTNEIAAAAGILLTQLEDAVCSETEAGVIAAAAAKKIATGSYTCNETDDRQITTGFKCSFVLIMRGGAATTSGLIFLIPSMGKNAGGVEDTADNYLHATDGFVVSSDGINGNYGTSINYYYAISE